ncbi:MAG: hypothetical protein M0Z82_08685 [Actinomycetota bacterium]|nr:hypothetical protein [Actinomycetota bacterium]
MSNAIAEQLSQRPERVALECFESDGEVRVCRGPQLLAIFDKDDIGMRNVVAVNLTDVGFSCKDVAACFGLSAPYMSMLRARRNERGCAGLVRPRGRRRSLSASKLRIAEALSDKGTSDRAIAKRFGVHPGTIGRQLKALRASRGTQEELDASCDEPPTSSAEASEEESEAPETIGEAGGAEQAEEPQADAAGKPDVRTMPPAPLMDAMMPSRYAGAMLLHAYLCRLGVNDVLSSLPSGPSRRYDAASLVLSATFGFALGIDSMEGSKHLRVADAGALVGLERFPDLRTLRPRLHALAQSSDPLRIQRSVAKAMLATDERPPDLYYVDDHFVTYWGARPVAKGWNNRRHIAEAGRDDTFVVDDHWRAICFSSGEPRGLSVSLPEVLCDLTEIVGDHTAMIGFDRGGSYPKVFSAIAELGWDWVTWRRAPLVAPQVEPKWRSVAVNGRRRSLCLADELVELKDYDATPVRQISAFENHKVVFEVLTSNRAFDAVPMVYKLKGRWSIENANKYLEANQGIHWLSSYEMDLTENTALVPNPARKDARAKLKKATDGLAEAERALGAAIMKDYEDVDDYVSVIKEASDRVAIAKDALKRVPAKLPANSLDPNAKRAKPALAARSLQMVCRLLAYNAELDLARRLNAYLDDIDEHRSITRHLLCLGGRIAYTSREITVTLDRPDQPRIARALGELVSEINAGPEVHLAGDKRPITYWMRGS